MRGYLVRWQKDRRIHDTGVEVDREVQVRPLARPLAPTLPMARRRDGFSGRRVSARSVGVEVRAPGVFERRWCGRGTVPRRRPDPPAAAAAPGSFRRGMSAPVLAARMPLMMRRTQTSRSLCRHRLQSWRGRRGRRRCRCSALARSARAPLVSLELLGRRGPVGGHASAGCGIPRVLLVILRTRGGRRRSRSRPAG